MGHVVKLFLFLFLLLSVPTRADNTIRLHVRRNQRLRYNSEDDRIFTARSFLHCVILCKNLVDCVEGQFTHSGNTCRLPKLTSAMLDLANMDGTDSFSTKMNCKRTQTGFEYNGHLSVTTSGKTCLNWATYPSPGNLDPSYYPEKNLTDAVNYCRNGDATEQGPWCYMNVGEGAKWEACDVKFCAATDCKRTQAGTEYVGKLSVTTSGKKCLNWATHPTKKYLDSDNPTKFIREKKLADAVNYCRNGDNSSEGPWCYIDNDGNREICAIQYCPDATKT